MSVDLIVIALLVVQSVVLWIVYAKHKDQNSVHQQTLMRHHEQMQDAEKTTEEVRRQYQTALTDLSQVQSRYEESLIQIRQLNQQVEEFQHCSSSAGSSADNNSKVSDLDHNVGIMIKLWGEHIAQVVHHQSDKNDQIGSMLDRVADDVKIVASDLDVTHCVSQMVGLVHESRKTLDVVLSEQQSGAEEKRQTIQELDASVQQINRVEEIVQVMHKLTFTTQLLASNAAVAAARASGEEGRAFKVIAVRMADFAQEISASAREISRVIGEFKEIFDRNLDKTRQQIQIDLASYEHHTQRVNAVMGSLVGSAENANASGEKLASALETLESDVASAVRGVMVSLQYQDKMKQILDHVVASLRNVACKLDTGECLDIEALLKEEMGSYTTQEERELYRRKLTELGFYVEEQIGDEHVLDDGEMMFF